MTNFEPDLFFQLPQCSGFAGTLGLRLRPWIFNMGVSLSGDPKMAVSFSVCFQNRPREGYHLPDRPEKDSGDVYNTRSPIHSAAFTSLTQSFYFAPAILFNVHSKALDNTLTVHLPTPRSSQYLYSELPLRTDGLRKRP